MDLSQWRRTILLVEDNPTEVTLLQIALQRYCTVPYLVSVVGAGDAALTFLHQRAPYTEAPRPDLILLDVDRPNQEGWAVLATLRATPAWNTIPIILLTGLIRAEEAEHGEGLSPTGGLLKPLRVEQYLPVVRALEAVLRATGHPTPPHTEESVLQRGPDLALQEQGETALTEAKEALAAADEMVARTRKALQVTHETLHQLWARRAREAAPPLARSPRSTPSRRRDPPSTRAATITRPNSPEKNDHVHLSDATAPLSVAIPKVQATVETARDLLARTHQVLDTTRQLIHTKQEILHYNHARRERQAEQTATHATPVPHAAGSAILLLSESPAEIARFRYALEEAALPCQLKFLMDRSEVEGLVRQAATSAPLFRPRLILTEGQLPGMEAEEIVAALRAVPAHQGIPLLLFSVVAAAEGHRRCRQCGAR